MLYISYDFSNDKTRTKFAKFLNKFGIKKQYSVYMIKNSERLLENILIEIKKTYKNKFDKKYEDKYESDGATYFDAMMID